MTATARAYRPRFYSETVDAPDPDDCTICSGLALYDAATLGEGVTRPDGRLFDTIRLRELRDEAGLEAHGDARLDELAKYLRFISSKAGIVPPFKLEFYPGHNGSLSLSFAQFRKRISNGHIGILLGSPGAITNQDSPLRTVQVFDGFKHAVALMDGGVDDALLFDPLNRKPPTFDGVRCSWVDLKQFTEARDEHGQRMFGDANAIGCAVAPIGSETSIVRAERAAALRLAGVQARISKLQGRASTATADLQASNAQRDQARLDLQTATAQRDTANAQRDQARLDLQTANAQRDQARLDLQTATTERDTANAQRITATTERDQARLDLQTANAQRDQARLDLQTATAERDTANAERDQARLDLMAVNARLAALQAQHAV